MPAWLGNDSTLLSLLQYYGFSALALLLAFLVGQECRLPNRRKDYIIAGALLGLSCWFARTVVLHLPGTHLPSLLSTATPTSAPTQSAFFAIMVLWLGMVFLGIYRGQWWMPVVLAPFAVPTWRSFADLPPLPSYQQYAVDIAICLAGYGAGRIITALRDEDRSLPTTFERYPILRFMRDDTRSIYRFLSRRWFIVAALTVVTLLPMSGRIGAELGIYNIFQEHIAAFSFFWALLMGLLYIHHMIVDRGQRLTDEVWRAVANPKPQDTTPPARASDQSEVHLSEAITRSRLLIPLNFLPLTLIPLLWLYFFSAPEVPPLSGNIILSSLSWIFGAMAFLSMWFTVVSLMIIDPPYERETSFADRMISARAVVKYATRNIVIGIGFGLITIMAFSIKSPNWGLDTHFLIVFLLMSVSTAYVIYQSASYHGRLLLIVAVALLFTPSAFREYAYVLPGLSRLDGTSYYQHPVALKQVTPPSRAPLIDPVQVLTNWRARQPQATKPKLVIFATSGGGYRATFWSALILDQLQRESQLDGKMPGLLNSVRLMTGASGGMVAAAYHVTNNPQQPFSLVERIQRDVANASPRPQPTSAQASAPVAIDSLSSVAYQLVMQDLVFAALPWPATTDRGIALEGQWSSLAVTFESLRQAELEGARPSLLLTPVIVETGQPMFFSNLDLAPDGKSELQFFNLFPEAYTSFRLQTAVRANASFPYISPIAALPTTPKRHLADAGYHDNFGINAAVTYLAQEKIAHWIRQNTSGIILVQIRAYPTVVRGIDDLVEPACRQPSAAGMFDAGAPQVHQVTAPVQALLASRETATRTENERQLQFLQSIYSTPSPGADQFVQMVMFENAAKSSLSWYLPIAELECMRDQLASLHNRRTFERLAKLWDTKEKDPVETAAPSQPAVVQLDTGSTTKIKETPVVTERPPLPQAAPEEAAAQPKKSSPKKMSAPDWKAEVFRQQ